MWVRLNRAERKAMKAAAAEAELLLEEWVADAIRRKLAKP